MSVPWYLSDLIFNAHKLYLFYHSYTFPSFLHSKNKHVIAFELFGKGNNQCAKKKQDTYTMDVGQFAKAYVAQQQINYKLANKGNYGNPGSLDYLECTQVDYNDATVSSYLPSGISMLS